MLGQALKNLVTLTGKRIDEANQKSMRQQEAVRKNQMFHQANLLKADIKPHLESIVFDNIFFQEISRIHIGDCIYDENNKFWKISMKIIMKSQVNLDSPRVILSLNETKEIYFHQLYLKMQEELEELSLMAEASNSNPINIEIARNQLRRRYELLNHQLVFQLIECFKEDNSKFVKIWLSFK